jgi:hypothetical protein
MRLVLEHIKSVNSRRQHDGLYRLWFTPRRKQDRPKGIEYESDVDCVAVTGGPSGLQRVARQDVVDKYGQVFESNAEVRLTSST